ncbi:MAG TPA: PIN domain-containing protein [Verrucomicrobiae bacterium]|nr:PIN domain-containing protein [Verrucomicrobiae bacterium]
MKALLDLNVLLDVIQNRQPHYADSARILSAARSRELEALIPFHAVTTIFYLIERAHDAATANHTVDWLLQHFEVSTADKTTLVQARLLKMKDFEDAVVASAAARHRCDFIVTRNVVDFSVSPIKAILPADLLKILSSWKKI